MELFEAIEKRRSIRRFLTREVPPELVSRVIDAGIRAPSAKNGQQWKFYVTTGEGKAAALDAMERGLTREERSEGLFDPAAYPVRAARYTLAAMRQAPVAIFVYNSEGTPLWERGGEKTRFLDSINIQSVAAAIENMLLAATALGLGGLWICDTVFACREIGAALGEDGQLVAAVSLGYPDEDPAPRARKPAQQVTVYIK